MNEHLKKGFLKVFFVLILIVFVFALENITIAANFVSLDYSARVYNSTASKTCTLPFTVGYGNDRLMLVAVSYHDNYTTGAGVTSVNFPGTTFTKVQKATYLHENTELWQGLNPTSGNGTLTVNFATPVQGHCGAISFSGVDQTNPLSSITTQAKSSQTVFANVVSATGNMTVSFVGIDSGDISSNTQSTRWLDNGLYWGSAGASTASGAPSVTHSWTANWNAPDVTLIAANINSSGAGAGTNSTTTTTSPTPTPEPIPAPAPTSSQTTTTVQGDLCSGLYSAAYDKLPHPMTALTKPSLLQTVVDPQFGATIRRITAVADGPGDDIIKPLYSTIPAWNADESKMMLQQIGGNSGYKLYDGKTYAFIRDIPISTNAGAEEDVYWHPTDPNVLFYTSGISLKKYLVDTNTSVTVRTFNGSGECGTGSYAALSGGGDPMYTSWDPNKLRIGLVCGDYRYSNFKIFTYDIGTNTIVGGPRAMTSGELPPQAAPSGDLFFQTIPNNNGNVLNSQMTLLRKLDMANSEEHASLGRLANGRDTWNGVSYDTGPSGAPDAQLLYYDLTTGAYTVIIGRENGYPYSQDGHISALTIKNPGWVVLSIVGDPKGDDLLDNELVLANTNTKQVCRVAHVRTYGKLNTKLATPYWAEAHAVPSPSGTRIVFASDWGNGSTVDTYVVELPSYNAAIIPTAPTNPTPTATPTITPKSTPTNIPTATPSPSLTLTPAPTPTPNNNSYNIGDTIKVVNIGRKAKLHIRLSPAGKVVGYHKLGDYGTIIDGPVIAGINGSFYSWWKIDFSSQPDGWVTDRSIEKAYFGWLSLKNFQAAILKLFYPGFLKIDQYLIDLIAR